MGLNDTFQPHTILATLFSACSFSRSLSFLDYLGTHNIHLESLIFTHDRDRTHRLHTSILFFSIPYVRFTRLYNSFQTRYSQGEYYIEKKLIKKKSKA
ncbi:hypothetical protein L6452_28055 [Arctium lappa]|uniref:Uncharacterized protein n=1 Tax=Arctium lappa TaxID=4217 RepID=A0ACB8ZX67_ARCLA|nr:hypothetical protein L6452_28055 [Arctium lappa]